MYEITLEHPGLNRHRVIRGQDPEIVQRRADYIKAIWNDQWESRLPAETAREAREVARREQENAKAAEQERKKIAEERKKEAEAQKKAAEARRKAAKEQVEARRQSRPDPIPEKDPAGRSAPHDDTSFAQKVSIQRSQQDFPAKSRILDYLWPFTMRRGSKADGGPNPATGLG